MDVDVIRNIIVNKKEYEITVSNCLSMLMIIIPYINSLLTISVLIAPNPYQTLILMCPIISLLSLVAIGLTFYVINRWVRIRNMHFNRQLNLMENLIGYLISFAEKKE